MLVYCGGFRILDITNKMIKYLSIDKWYHGTTLDGWKSICKFGVLANYNIGNELDFGYGFYLTPKQKEAEKYILNLLKYEHDMENDIKIGVPLKENKGEKIPLVIEFSFSPIQWYSENKYNFKFLNKYDDEFAEFVFHNRLKNINGNHQHNHDIIFGVMSDSLPVLLIQKYKAGEISREEVIQGLIKPTSNKQLSLHSQKLCGIIKPTKVILIESREELNVNDYIGSNRSR